MRISPTRFRAGDIVDVQVGFVAVRPKGSQSHIRLVLRAISIDDASVTEVRISHIIIDRF